MDWKDILPIGIPFLGTLLSPFIALWLSRVVTKREELRKRQFEIFKSLYLLRDPMQGASPERVQAISLIQLEFSETRQKTAFRKIFMFWDKSPEKILEKYKSYFPFLMKTTLELERMSDPEKQEHYRERDARYFDLLNAMAEYFDYKHLDQTTLRSSYYIPTYLATREQADRENPLLMHAWLSKQLEIMNTPNDDQNQITDADDPVNNKLEELLDGKRTIRVELDTSKDIMTLN